MARWTLPCEADPDEPPGQLRVYFGLHSTKVSTPGQRKSLNEIVALLKSHPERELEILGQADGNEIPTKQIAQARIDSVVSYLVAQGVDSRRIWTATLGATNLLSPAPSAGNRNVELRLKPPLRCGCLP